MQSRDLLFEPCILSQIVKGRVILSINVLCDSSHPNRFGFVIRENMHLLPEECNVFVVCEVT